MGFSVLRFWLFFRSAQLVSGFRKQFFGFGIRCGFLFFVFCPLWVPFSLRFECQLISNSRETPNFLIGMREKEDDAMLGDHASRKTPEIGRSFGQFPMCLSRQQRKKQLWLVLRFLTRRGRAATIFKGKSRLL